MANMIGRTQNAKRNMSASLILQIITAINGLILPRLIISSYGSEVNGIVASISQFLSYISLLEAGVGGVFRASMYSPLLHNDNESVSSIFNEQVRFYRKIGKAFIIYVIGLCAVYPFVVKTNVDKEYILALIIILSVGTFVEYFVSLPHQSLIMADQMVRLVYVITSVVIIVNIIASYFLISMGASIIVVKIVSCLIALAKPITYVWYTKTHYCIDSKAKPDENALNQRWNGMIHHLAYYIHKNTDVVILTILVNASAVSIYCVYLAVVSGIEKIITSISSGISASIGNMLAAGDKKTIDRNIDIYEFVQSATSTALFTITALLLIPFIALYTSGIHDANYYQPLFGYMLIIAEVTYCYRTIYSTVSSSGNKYKETQLGAVLEAVINLGVSLVLISLFHSQEMQLLGIATGTFLGMLSRLVFEVIYLSRNLINRPIHKALKSMSINLIVAFSSFFACKVLVPLNCESVFQWIVSAVACTIIVSIIALTIYWFCERDLMKETIRKLRNR